jgi:hypothetical protein
MHMHRVTSSQIKEIGHDPATDTLAIRFNTGVLYHYAGVNAKKFAEFHAAKSIGSHFGAHIRGQHDYQKIIETQERS